MSRDAFMAAQMIDEIAIHDQIIALQTARPKTPYKHVRYVNDDVIWLFDADLRLWVYHQLFNKTGKRYFVHMSRRDGLAYIYKHDPSVTNVKPSVLFDLLNIEAAWVVEHDEWFEKKDFRMVFGYQE